MFKVKSAVPASPVSAVVVEGKLILTLANAMTPVVWQMDLDQTKSAALEVIEDKKKNAFCLMQRNIKGEVIEIAPFEKKEYAVEALMVVSAALREAQGKMRPANTNYIPQDASTLVPHMQQKKSGRAGGFIALFMILFLVIIFLISALSRPSGDTDESTLAQASGGGAPVQGGVPVSADDFLSNQP